MLDFKRSLAKKRERDEALFGAMAIAGSYGSCLVDVVCSVCYAILWCSLISRHFRFADALYDQLFWLSRISLVLFVLGLVICLWPRFRFLASSLFDWSFKAILLACMSTAAWFVTYVWGPIGLVVGTLLYGFGVIPESLLAAIVSHHPGMFGGQILGLIVVGVVFAAKTLTMHRALKYAESFDTDAMPIHQDDAWPPEPKLDE